MRSLCLPALILGLFLATTPPCQAASQPSNAPSAASQPVSRDAPLWPYGLAVGYISIGLKRQLRRRGYPGNDRTQAFSDLISLRPDDDPPTSADQRAAPEDVPRNHPLD